MYSSAKKVNYQKEFLQLGDFILLAREQNRMSQAILAERAAVDEKTISHIENCHANPTAITIYSLCTALNCQILIYNPIYSHNIFTKKAQNVLSHGTIDFISFM